MPCFAHPLRSCVALVWRSKSAFFKLSNGEFISPEHLEGVFGSSRYVFQMFVHGESDQAFLCAVVVAHLQPLLRSTHHTTSLSSSHLPPAPWVPPARRRDATYCVPCSVVSVCVMQLGQRQW
jgi:hypothetical protein